MKLQHIQTVIAIAEEGTIRGASRRLNRTQPAMTKALHQIEEDLGVALFLRTPQGVKVTEMGQIVVARARTIAMEIDRLESEVEQLKGGRLGSVNVCVSPAAATMILPRALKSFRAYYPEVDVAVSDGLYPAALQDLRNGHFDIVVGPRPSEHWSQDIRVSQLFSMDVVVVTGGNSKWKNVTTLEELQNADWMMLGNAQGPGDIIAQCFEKMALVPPVIRTAAPSFLSGVGAIEKSDMVCTFPKLLYETLRGRGFHLQRLDSIEPVASLEISMLTRAEHPLTPAAEKMATCISWWGHPDRVASD